MIALKPEVHPSHILSCCSLEAKIMDASRLEMLTAPCSWKRQGIFNKHVILLHEAHMHWQATRLFCTQMGSVQGDFLLSAC